MWQWRIIKLTRDRTAEAVLRDQIRRRERGQGNIHFPCSADHEEVGNRLIYTLLLYKGWDDYTFTYLALHDIHTYISVQEMNRVQQSIFDII